MPRGEIESIVDDAAPTVMPAPPNGSWARRRCEQWLQENAAAIQSYNEFAEKHGMVLDEYRLF